jgi:hypothetical protein
MSKQKAGRPEAVTNRPRKKTEGGYDRLPRDWYPEPAWCAHALFREERFDLPAVFDPFCGLARVLDGARRHGKRTEGADIFPQVKRGAGHVIRKVNSLGRRGQLFIPGAHTVTNCPFVAADEILERMARGELKAKAALFLRLSALQGKSRLLEKLPLSFVWVCRPRPACLPPEHKLRAPMRGNGGQIDFAWFVFDPAHDGSTWRGWWLSRDPHKQTYPAWHRR